MSETINPSLSFTYWDFAVGSDRTNRVSYPTENWSIPAGHSIVNVYYQFDYSANLGIYYNFPYINAEQNYDTESVAGSWKTEVVNVPIECWEGTHSGSQSSFRIGFRATTGSGKTSGAKRIRNLALYIEYQSDAVPSTVSVMRVNIGDPQEVTLTNESSSVCHRVWWEFKSGGTTVLQSSVFQLDAATRSVSWAVPSGSIATVCALAPANSSTVEGTVWVETYTDDTYSVLVDDTSLSYTAQLTMTAEQGSPAVSTSVSGTFDAGTPAEVQALGQFVQNFSTLHIVPTVTPKYGATITSVGVSTPSGYHNTTSGGDVSIKLTTSGQYQFAVTVADSRGFATTSTYSINVAECALPAFTSVNFWKTSSASSSVEDDEGGYVYVSATVTKDRQATFPASSMTVSVKEEGSSSVFVSASFTPTLVNDVWTANGYVGDTAHLLDKETTYTITFSVTDSRGLTSTYAGVISAALYTIHRQSGGKGVAFGKISELFGVEVNKDWPFYTHGQEIEKLIVDCAHPVGSVLQTFDDGFNPNEKWTWTLWTKLKDVFLYATGTKLTAQSGGSTENGINGYVYEYPADSGRYLWNSPGNMLMQGDGNLVVYSEDPNVATWSTGTYSSSPDPSYSHYTFTFGETAPAVNENNMPPYLTVNMWVRVR